MKKTPIALPTFASHVTANTIHGLALPSADRNAPSRTKVSAGMGGTMFSMAAPTPMMR
jgi:hypothetical protein